MGFFAGVVQELNRIEDKKERREMFKEKLLEQRKNAILPVLMERVAKRTEAAAAKKERVLSAIDYGLSKETASLLEADGRLGGVLAKLEKSEGGNRSSIEKLNNLAKDVPREKIADAMEYALDLGFDQDATTDKYIEAIYATTDEAFMKSATELAGMSARRTAPRTGGTKPFRLGALEALDLTEIAKVRKQIEASLMTQVETSTEGGIQVFKNPKAAGRIVDKAVEHYVTRQQDPFVTESPMTTLADITESTRAWINSSGGEVSRAAEAIDYNTPIQDIPVYKAPPPPPVGDGDAADSVEEDALERPDTSLEAYTTDIIEDLHGGFK